jgi:hypothetical protein
VIERFNGRIEQTLLSHRCRSGETLEQTVMRDLLRWKGKLR